MGGEEERGQNHHHDDEREENSTLRVVVHQFSAEPGADNHADAVGHQHDPHEACRQASDFRHRPRNVGVDGEHAAKSDSAHEQGEQNLRLNERAELGQRVRREHEGHVRQRDPNRDQGD